MLSFVLKALTSGKHEMVERESAGVEVEVEEEFQQEVEEEVHGEEDFQVDAGEDEEVEKPTPTRKCDIR